VRCRECCVTLCTECDVAVHASPNLHARTMADEHGAAVPLQPSQRLQRAEAGYRVVPGVLLRATLGNRVALF
jgi:hypothetical protein